MIPARIQRARKSKYRSEPTWVDGYRFDSKREARVYQVLEADRKEGRIKYFLRQVPIHLAPGGDHKQTPVLMRVDFLIVDLDGTIRYVDAKGFATPDWRNKAAMAEQLYGITIETW